MFVLFFSDLNLMLDITINRRAAWWRVSEVHHIHSSTVRAAAAAAIGCRLSRDYCEDGVSKWR